MRNCLPPNSLHFTLQIVGNLLSVLSAYFWVRFASLREEHQLSAPSLHHRVFLRVILVTSTVALCLLLASVMLQGDFAPL